MDLEDEMEVLGHDDVVLDFNHRVVGSDGGEQFVLHHLADGGEGGMGSRGSAIGGGEVPHDATEGLPKAVCHMQGDVVEAGGAVVMSRCAAGHAVLGGVSLFHFISPCGKTAGHQRWVSYWIYYRLGYLMLSFFLFTM